MWHTDKNNNKPTGLFFFFFALLGSHPFSADWSCWCWLPERHICPEWWGEMCIFFFFLRVCIWHVYVFANIYIRRCSLLLLSAGVRSNSFFFALAYPRISSHVFIWSRQVKHIEKKDNQCNVCITFIRNAENAVYVSCFMHSHHKLYWFRFDGYE